MNEPANASVPPPVPPPTNDRRRSYLLLTVIGVFVIIALAVGAWLWFNRPITPVELSQQETQVLERKIDNLEPAEETVYEPGSKEIVFTERELNGLIHTNTELGDKLKLTLVTDAVHARMETDLDQDLPLVGGRRLKAKARFFVKDVDGRPSLVLDDLTVWGASLPNDWLGGMKGKDLLGDILTSSSGTGVAGIESLRIERGQLVIRLAE